MKRVVSLFSLVIFLSGCSSMFTPLLTGMKDGGEPSYANTKAVEKDLIDLEESEYVYEKTFGYSYKEVFLASLTAMRDLGANVYLKDYDKGIILVRPELQVDPMAQHIGALPVSFGTPGKRSGLFLERIGEEKTKVILRAIRVFPTYGTASAEDVFISIEKEIVFTERMKNEL